MNQLRSGLVLSCLFLVGCGRSGPFQRMVRAIGSFFEALAKALLVACVTLYIVLTLAALRTVVRNLGEARDRSGLGFALSVPHLIFGAIGVVAYFADGMPLPSQPDYALILGVYGMSAGSLVTGLVCFAAAWRARA